MSWQNNDNGDDDGGVDGFNIYSNLQNYHSSETILFSLSKSCDQFSSNYIIDNRLSLIARFIRANALIWKNLCRCKIEFENMRMSQITNYIVIESSFWHYKIDDEVISFTLKEISHEGEVLRVHSSILNKLECGVRYL